jgi:hypothetical protein
MSFMSMCNKTTRNHSLAKLLEKSVRSTLVNPLCFKIISIFNVDSMRSIFVRRRFNLL